jgi:signal recognition particle subunit SRP54
MKQFEQMSKMMKMMQGPGGKKTMGGMKGMPEEARCDKLI